MPIQFRCPACDRLLGIARRKAGMMVKCPRCSVEVQVPAMAGMAVESGGPVGPANAARPISKSNGAAKDKRLDSLPLFERPDFEELLNPNRAKPRKTDEPAATPVKPLVGTHKPDRDENRGPDRTVQQEIDVVAIEEDLATPSPDGVFLKPTHMAILAVGAGVMMCVSFAAGFMLANSSKPPIASTTAVDKK
jgi:hypothetical protein